MNAQALDLSGYLERIGLEPPLGEGLALLEEVHLRHLDQIPFENIDVRLGRGIRLDLESLQEKLVRRRRGGYCFEQNTLAAAALRALGFEVATLEARVRPPGASGVLPRTHMVLRVAVEGQALLFDVGFGGDGPLLPVPFDGRVSEQADAEYRLAAESEDLWVLRRRSAEEWADLYAFSERPALPIDFEVANHFTSTYPESIFRRALTVQRSSREERRILRNDTYTVRRGAEEARRVVQPEELADLLPAAFGLQLTSAELEALQVGAPFDPPATT